ncbi:MAG TPA: Hsp20/alpha crystallin family protein [Nitrospiraceae bacterium]|nr:Hsp20/alpha crystallin family protein [Nitrospiraceae bacterium]
MTLTTYSPFDVDALLNEALRTVNGKGTWAPACNAFEDEHGYQVHAAVPGIDRKDIEIVMEDGVLTLKGERKDEATDSKRAYFSREIGVGAFSRSFKLPTDADPNKVSASYKEGMLTISVAKREEAKPRRITIE